MTFGRRCGLMLVWGGSALALFAENSPGPGYLGISSGAAEVLAAKKISLLSAEYRFAADYRGIHPLLLVTKAKDGASYAGVAAFHDFELSPVWRLTVSFGPGYYARNRRATDLASSMEFFSNLELSARIYHEDRLALSFGHRSNGSTGNHNPGSEVLRLVFLISFR